jgi:hypothetical protein
MRFDALYCPNCGNARVTSGNAAHAASIFLMVVLGVVAALPAWLVLSIAVTSLLDRVGAAAGPEPEFYVSWGATGFFIFLTLLAVTGLFVQARLRLSVLTRTFAVSFLAVMLGLLSLCDVFALSSQRFS